MRPLRFLLAALALVLAAPVPSHAALTRAKDADEPLQSQGAARLQLTLQRFKELAARQPSLHVTPAGNLAYKCPRPRRAPVAARIVGEDNSTFIAPAPQPLANTFTLHSRPGATRVLYLDFDGHTLTGTDWNADYAQDPINVRAFDIDGVAGFSDEERAIIQQVWRRVAEDFAPFDVDVTTEDPGVDGIISNGVGDTRVGVRALIGDDAAYLPGEDPAGLLGLALVGTYGGATDNPALVFALEHGNDYALIADTVSHEVGHTLDLLHHGSDVDGEYYGGHGIWAPIMGSGPSDSVSQWSRGDYAGATNPTQDDLAVISGFIPLAASDHPVDQAAADAAAAVDPIVPADVMTGTLRAATDVAWYKFAASAGTATFTGSVASLGPNLKLGLTIRDSAGNIVATSAADRRPLSATLTANLPRADFYYLVVDGIGYLDVDTGFTDYASIGRFSVAGTWQLNRPPLASTAGSSPLLGKAPLRVTFDGRGSFDADGTIAAYAWSFSDGQTAVGPTPLVTFATPGVRTATLTVTDNTGATHATDVKVTATAGASFARPMSIVAASASWVTVSRTTGRATATFRIVDSAGRPLPGVTVTATVSGLDNSNVTAVSDRAGNAVLSTAEIPTRSRGTATFTVRSATLTPYEYLPARNKVSTAALRR